MNKLKKITVFCILSTVFSGYVYASCDSLNMKISEDKTIISEKDRPTIAELYNKELQNEKKTELMEENNPALKEEELGLSENIYTIDGTDYKKYKSTGHLTNKKSDLFNW